MELFAKKSLGQHFLNSSHVLEQIISASNIQKGENVLEIGPGTGILTRALLDAGARVIAIEKDIRALSLLQEKFKAECASGQLTLISGDILTIERTGLNLKASEYALVANIPYYITGAILEAFLEYAPRPNRMVLLVQKEVAERIVAKDKNGEDGGKESILSVSVKAFGTPKLIAKVPRGAFTPPPTVDSAILQISDVSDKRFTEKSADIRKFFTIVRAGFAHKRKFLKRNLESLMNGEEIAQKWQKSGLDDKIRAEDLSVGQWMDIAL